MTSTAPATSTTAPPALTARECAGHAASNLKTAAAVALSQPDAAAALVRVADGWRLLAGDTARTPDMAPTRTDDDN
jgi:hypothetical protein